MKGIDNFAAKVTQLSTKGKLNAGGDSLNNFIKTHKKGTTESILKGSSDIKNIMRNEALILSYLQKNEGKFVPQEVYKRPSKETGKKFLKEGEQLAKRGFKLARKRW